MHAQTIYLSIYIGYRINRRCDSMLMSAPAIWHITFSWLFFCGAVNLYDTLEIENRSSDYSLLNVTCSADSQLSPNAECLFSVKSSYMLDPRRDRDITCTARVIWILEQNLI